MKWATTKLGDVLTKTSEPNEADPAAELHALLPAILDRAFKGEL